MMTTALILAGLFATGSLPTCRAADEPAAADPDGT